MKTKKYRERARSKRGIKLGYKAKKRLAKKRMLRQTLEHIIEWEKGPSPYIIYDSYMQCGNDGKVVKFIKRTGNKKRSEYTTEMSKAATEAYRAGIKAKKDLIKSILNKAGFHPELEDKRSYTRATKKLRNRIVRDNFFAKPKIVTLTDEQLKKEREEVKEMLKEAKKQNDIQKLRDEMQKRFEEEVVNNPLPPKKGAQATPSVDDLMDINKEKPNNRKFRYVISKRTSMDPMRTYDFMTDYFNADTKVKAFNKVKEIAKTWEKSEDFAGITLQDIEGDNVITYYTRSKLLAA